MSSSGVKICAAAYAVAALLAAFFLFVPPAFADVTPVGYWKFDETTAGVNAIDSIGSNDAVPSGDPQPSTDVPNVDFTDTGSMSFDGSNYFTISRPVQDNFSICAWIKTTSTGGGTNHWQSAPIMDSEVSGLAHDFGFGIGNGGKLMFGNGGSFDSQVNGATTINDDVWHNVCATRNGTTGAVNLYVDAKLDGTGTTSTGTLNSNSNARIGFGYDGAAHYVGLIDDVRAYGTDLSQTQLLSLFQGNNDPDTPPDTTPPVLSNIGAASIATSSAAVGWTSDENASSKVVYSADTQYASSTVEGDTSPRVTSHSQTVTGLATCTLYNYEVVSADAAGNYATSTSNTFTTTGCAGGATPSSATSTSVTVSAAATSTITDGGNTLTVATPANFTATSSSVVIQIKGLPSDTVLDSIGTPSSSLTSAASLVFDVTALINNTTVLDSFDSPVTISYTYTDADISGLDENSLVMYHYHDGAWLPLDDCSVDTGTNTITCNAPSFSTFAIFGTVLATTNTTSSGGGALPWCSGPMAPGWNVSLPGGGCGDTTTTSVVASSATAALCPHYTFTRTLKYGMTGEDVRALQQFLNCAGFSLGASGPGFAGQETNLFVGRTLAALKKFQQTYSSDILLPISTTTPTGIFAAYSQKKAYSLMVSQ